MPEFQPNLVTKTKFAELCNVSAMAISKASKEGRVKVDKASSKIDLNHPTNQEYQKAGNHQRGGQQKKGEQVDDIDLINTPLHELNENQLKKRKLITQIVERDQKNAEHRGDLVALDLVGKFFGEIEAIDKKQLLNVAKRSTPEILAVLEADEDKSIMVETIIDAEIWKVFEQKKHKIMGFLESLEGEE
jgi:hypothetical protein